jgi:DNA-binding winged helix-turn-helix (wHTH) protein
MDRPAKIVFTFDGFCLDATERLLWRDGDPVALTPKAFDTLLLLVQNNGRVLEKDQLMNTLWPDSIVEEANLTQTIYMLRKTLGEGTAGPKFIETIPKRGYRFVAPVSETVDEEPALIVEQHTRSRIVIEEEESEGMGERANGRTGEERGLRTSGVVRHNDARGLGDVGFFETRGRRNSLATVRGARGSV